MYSQIVSGSYMYTVHLKLWENKINLQHVYVYVFWDNILCNLYFYIKKLGRDGNLILANHRILMLCILDKWLPGIQTEANYFFCFEIVFFLLELKIEPLCYLWCFKACRTIFCNYWQFILHWKKKKYYSIHITV